MLLKPATPLTTILLVAFAFLLLSVLSTPIVKAIPLAKVGDISFGVLGYCSKSQCSEFRVGYDFDGELRDAGQHSQFNLPTNIRASLSSLLIVHPVAAFLTLVCLLLAAAAHLHSPSHSPRYLLGLLILLLPTLLVSMLAFLVDILLFVPHLQWGGWIVLAATILLTVAGVMTCAMRRTLVSRKARKRRIAENAEMSGENYYNRQNTIKLDPTPVVTTTVSTSAPTADSLPTFATFPSRSRSPDNDERPLTSQSPPPPGFVPESTTTFYTSPSESEPYGPPGPMPGERPYGRDVPPPGPPGPPYGTPPPMRGGYVGPRRGRGPGYGPPRGRGGFPMRGRGGYPSGPRGGPPPHGYSGRGGPPRGAMMGRGRSPTSGYPPHNPDMGPSIDSDTYGAYGYGPRGPSPRMRGPSPVGVVPGQDIELETSPMNTYPGRQPSPGIPPVQSPTSLYSHDTYTSPRSQWNNEPTLPVVDPVPPSRSPVSHVPQPGAGQGYYEDVDPRFAESTAAPLSSDSLPSTLTPGGQHAATSHPSRSAG
ncbi:hypothetical protein VTO42DRAFT_469 [Malbranchea cinnamomea]